VFVPKEDELSAPLYLENRKPSRIVRRISQAKAQAALRELRQKSVRNGLILSADTLVFLGNRVLGKPRSQAEAASMLRRLSGRTHTVCTAVTCLSFAGSRLKRKTIHVSTKVQFFRLQKDWIQWYLSTGEPMDKAGSYGAQGHGAVLVEKYSGSYTNVVGLPLGESLKLLEEVSGRSRSDWLRKK
jgi:septum formation protein